MAFIVSAFTPRNSLIILHIYLYLSSFSRKVSRSPPADLNHKTLYVSQLLSNPMSNSHSYITRHPTSTKPLLSNTKLIRGFRIAMNFSISMILIFLSNDISTNPGPNCSFSIPPPNVRGLKISQLNTRSILPKIDSLRLLMKDNPYDVFSVSETWLKPSISDAEISLPGYSVVRMDRCEKIGGGTAIYVRDSLPFKTHSDLMINELENCMIEILRPKTKKLFICCVYRAPNKPLENYINQLNSVILKLPNESEFILLGDFNVDLSTNSRSPSRQMLNNFSRQLHLDQVITQPTRITETSQTMIDLIFVNNSHRIVRNGVIPCSLSDHSLVFCVFKSGVPKAPPRTIEYRSYKHYNKQSFLQDLKDADWSAVVDDSDINTTVNNWCKQFIDLADQHAPIKNMKVKGISIPWMTVEISQAMHDRDYHLKKAQKTQSKIHWSAYRKLRCLVNKQIREGKSSYYENLIKENNKNPSGLWKTLNEITSRSKPSSAPSSIISNGIEHKDTKSIASLFNNFFTNIGITLANAIKQKYTRSTPASNPPYQVHATFQFKEIEISSVIKQLSTLKTNKSTGLDRISARLLKDAATVIAPTLTEIFNHSLKSSTFPQIWKDGKVTPIFKSGDRSNMSNYRPITVLPILSKILERFVHTQIYNHLSENNILSPQQFGFRPKLSTSTALAFFTDNILDNADNGLVTASVFLDFSKAFDTVDHTILLRKLKSVGLDDNSLSWFHSYLTSRRQITSINDKLSTSLPVTVGVPQGSILGPLLFIIYVNDMPNVIKHCKIILYADDTLYYSSTSANDINKYVNEDLNLISQWLADNLLTLNCTKSKFLLFGSSSRLKSFTNISIFVNDHQLTRERTIKYLGITFSENLTWSDHLNKISTKINQRIGLLRRVKDFLPTKARLTVYNALILPLFDYADIIWGDKNNLSLMDQLQILQNKAAKTILDAPYLSSSTEALDKLYWHPLSHRRYLHRLLTIFKIKNNLTEFNFELPNTNHTYNTRRKDDIYLSKPKTNWGKQKLVYQGCKEYNALDYGIKSCEQLATFRNELFKIPSP